MLLRNNVANIQFITLSLLATGDEDVLGCQPLLIDPEREISMPHILQMGRL
jgi:hypothetical protein